MARLQLRRDTAANWTTANPILASGEMGYETDTGRSKIGDGTTAWNSLPYQIQSSGINGNIKISGVETNIYTHPTGDGNQHVPTTGTGNNGKVLKAGATAGSAAWGNVAASEVTDDATHRFVTDTEKTAWNAKQAALGFTPENSANKGIANGYASLGADGKVPNAQLPPLAITDTFVAATQAEMLALTVQVGDICVRTDLNKSFILRVDGASTLANWQELLTPPNAVISVNGQTGAVTIGVATTSTNGLMASTDKSKLDGIAAGANNYVHPASHPATMITEDSTHRFATDAEKTAWNAKQAALGFTPENVANKGVANGYAGLDANGKILTSVIPNSIVIDGGNAAGN